MFLLKEIMQEKGISNVELANRMKMTAVSISYLVNGKTEPNVTKIHELAKALNVEPWQFFCKELPVKKILPCDMTINIDGEQYNITLEKK